MIRLLQYNDDGEFSLTTFFADKIPKEYAILSHTWGAEEVTFEDLRDGTGIKKAGYEKIRFCGEQARRDGLQYFWVDTCCIDKSSSAELTEAINSMFRWYREAKKCYVYLSDVLRTGVNTNNLAWDSAFRESKWFTRGWTLQELIAPTSVQFFSKEGELLGDRLTLERHICEITGIPVAALRGALLSGFSITERMSWARRRKTTHEEDQAYSLLGIFNVNIPLIYGEKREMAMKRLEEEIDKAMKGNNLVSRELLGQVCKDCELIGEAIESAWSLPRTYRGGGRRLRESFTISIDSNQQPSCHFCCLLLAMIRLPYNSESTHGYKLRGFWASRLLCISPPFFQERCCDSVFFGVLPATSYRAIVSVIGANNMIAPVRPLSGEVMLSTKSFFGRQINPAYVKHGLMESWLAHCQTHHRETCGKVQRIEIPGFKVIDCDTERVVPAPIGCKYASLSYLWGSACLENPENDQKFIASAPPVITDSMTVTRLLGFRYLWVDRYCIPQDSDDEKLAQIQNMDAIYANSEVTIIAAAGEDPSYGLPGIGYRSRFCQPYVNIGTSRLVSTLPPPKDIVRSSKWAKRGWTYQEGLLSRRRLLFTDYQVIFECLVMQCQETIDAPTHLLHSTRHTIFLNSVDDIRVFPSRGLGKSVRATFDIIRDYVKRSLTHSSDTFNAILGIFQVLNELEKPIRNIWGLPIFPVSFIDADDPRKSPRGVTNNLAWSLGWVQHPPPAVKIFQAGLG
jgi:hypothetical protein